MSGNGISKDYKRKQMNLLQIKKHSQRFCCPSFLNYVRSLPCCVCNAPSTASHMISVKWSSGSDALAVNACMINQHHVQSTRTSKRILEENGIDIPALHQKLWNGFLAENANCFYQIITQEDFERVCEELGFVELPYTRRKNR